MEHCNIYSFQDYREYLEHQLCTEGETRGRRSKLAQFLGCRVSHITQALQGQSHFSLEMAEKTADFLKLSPSEKHYLLLLVSAGRAGTSSLKKYFLKQAEEICQQRTDVSNRLEVSDQLSQKYQQKYYSSWTYGAIHLCCSLPQVKTPEEISRYLGLDLRWVNEAVEFLIEAKVLCIEEGALRTTGRRLHLPAGHELLPHHQMNLRWKAIESIQKPEEGDLHFSAIYSISLEDFHRIRSRFLEMLEEAEQVVADSPQEDLALFALDFCQMKSTPLGV